MAHSALAGAAAGCFVFIAWRALFAPWGAPTLRARDARTGGNDNAAILSTWPVGHGRFFVTQFFGN